MTQSSPRNRPDKLDNPADKSGRYSSGAIFCILALLLIFIANHSANYACANSYQNIPCIIHIDTTFSIDGSLTLEQVVEKAKEKGVKVVIPTDDALTEAEYGIFPFRKIIKKKIEEVSVLKIGSEKYLNEIKILNEKNKDMLIIPGIETTAFYRWTGNPFKENLTMQNWHKHFLIVGLSEPAQYRELPISGNESNSGKFDASKLWGGIILILGIYLLSYWKKAWIIIFIGIGSIIYNFPFKSLPFDNYKDYGELPYQNLINYVNKNNGLIFYAHPEAINWSNPVQIGPVSVRTKPCTNSLLQTYDYTGFAYFREGYRDAGKPGGLWDEVLGEFCAGKRNRPVWAIGELDYINDKESGEIDTVQNILLLKDFTETSVIDCLKTGRFYVLYKTKPDNFPAIIKKLVLESENSTAQMGEILKCKSTPKLTLCITTGDSKSHKININIIRNGEIVKSDKILTPAEYTYMDKTSEGEGIQGQKSYYRIELISDSGAKIVTNPIFWGSGLPQ
ncbi:MAG: hypothetical protein AUJ85_06540 [Elusimicrobia bacterium CG1_02_37_114]|nr:MAG: hypothetical protein AUJ85_06540 [Elusimicrobia bacterium CG1_02_37_114]